MNKEAHYAELNQEDEVLLMSYVELHKRRRDEAWFLDSGCSNHMCGEQGMFTDLDETFQHSVKLGNNSKMSVTGKGSVKLIFNGKNHIVNEVYFVPELNNNLLSVGQLQENGLAILFKGGTCKIYHPERGLIAESKISINRMFILLTETQIVSSDQRCFHTNSQDLYHLWHRCYGHLSYTILQTLLHKKMVRGLPQFKVTDEVCAGCNIGKQRRDVIPKKSMWRVTQPLELIHADICGPITPMSNGGKKYFFYALLMIIVENHGHIC